MTKKVEPIIVKPCGNAPGTLIVRKGSPELVILGIVFLIVWIIFIVYFSLKFIN
jgi:hypothetical protein